mgnify:CR=1 FL=1
MQKEASSVVMPRSIFSEDDKVPVPGCESANYHSLTKQTDVLVRSVTAALWTAATNLKDIKGAEHDMIGERGADYLHLHQNLIEAARAQLVKSHPQLFTLREVVTRKRAFYSEATNLKRKRVALKPWVPTRPNMALRVARVLESDDCVSAVPCDKRNECRLPLKVFAKAIVLSIDSATEAPRPSHACILRTVTEVMARVFDLAQSACEAEDCASGIELHGSTDNAWKGTAARGSGIAMNEECRKFVTKAATQLADKLELYCASRL